MCEKPPRKWSAALAPPRIIAATVSLLLLVAGIIVSDRTLAVALITFGCVALLFAFVMPTLTAVEFGFPSVVKISAAIHNRQDRIKHLFERQRADLIVCAKLLCSDEKIAGELLEAAMARAASDWRGPADLAIRQYVLCWFIHRLTAYQELSNVILVPRAAAPDHHSALAQIVMVLADVGEVSAPGIADMVGMSTDEVQRTLADRRRSVLGMQGDRHV